MHKLKCEILFCHLSLCEVTLQTLILKLSGQNPMHVEAQVVVAGTPEGWRQLICISAEVRNAT